MRKRVLSLFSGCGGLDLGFHTAGFETVAAFDADRAAVCTFNENFEINARLADLSKSVDLPTDIDVVIAGPPCQGFSTGSGYSRINDPRNDLLLRTCDLISRVKPRVAVIENVSSLLNARNQGYLARALDILKTAGFNIDLRVINAEEFGIAQTRRRVIIIASQINKTYSLSSLSSHGRKTTLGDVLRGLNPTIDSHTPLPPELGSRDFLIASHIGPGKKLCNVRGGPRSVHTWNIPEVFGVTDWAEQEILLRLLRLRRMNRKRSFGDADPVSFDELQATFEQSIADRFVGLIDKGYIRRVDDLFDLTHTFNGKYKRLRNDNFAPTVDTRFGDIRLFVHPTEHRAMTVREAARIQGFPDSFKFPAQKNAAFRLIGNAVPPPLAQHLAVFVRSLF